MTPEQLNKVHDAIKEAHAESAEITGILLNLKWNGSDYRQETLYEKLRDLGTSIEHLKTMVLREYWDMQEAFEKEKEADEVKDAIMGNVAEFAD